MTKETTIKNLLGRTIIKIEGLQAGSDRISFLSKKKEFYMYHRQDCCETVKVYDVIGDPNDLLNSPIVRAEAPSSKDEAYPDDSGHDSFTWTFYILGTKKGTVTIRWMGESNGYYSESVDLFDSFIVRLN